MTENTNTERTQNGRDPKTGQFLLGHSGNGGRKPGSRNKLAEQFVADLHDEWKKSGASALQRLAQDDPAAFVKVTASILPREIDATLTVDSELFAEVRDFTEACRLAKSYIGADSDHPIIELQAVDDEEPIYGRGCREE